MSHVCSLLSGAFAATRSQAHTGVLAEHETEPHMQNSPADNFEK